MVCSIILDVLQYVFIVIAIVVVMLFRNGIIDNFTEKKQIISALMQYL